MTMYTAGDDVDAYCSKCELVLAHIIIATKADKPAKAECKTCKAKHAFKALPPGERKKPKKSEVSARRTEYEKLLEGRDIAQAQKYRTSAMFNQDELLEHKQFGIGVITRALSDKKIQVIFRDGVRVLIHGR